jgi:hypothetical protein
VAAAGLLAATYFRHWRVMAVAAGLAAASLLAAPTAFALSTATGSSSGPTPSAGPTGRGGFAGDGFGGPGRGGGGSASAALISFLEANRDGATYLVAAFGSQSSAPIIIASGQPVITIGGFNGGDPAPTLAQFEQLVAQHKVRFILLSAGGGFGGGGGLGAGGGSSISQWVTTHATLVPAASYGGSGTGSLYQLF